MNTHDAGTNTLRQTVADA